MSEHGPSRISFHLPTIAFTAGAGLLWNKLHICMKQIQTATNDSICCREPIDLGHFQFHFSWNQPFTVNILFIFKCKNDKNLLTEIHLPLLSCKPRCLFPRRDQGTLACRWCESWFDFRCSRAEPWMSLCFHPSRRGLSQMFGCSRMHLSQFPGTQCDGFRFWWIWRILCCWFPTKAQKCRSHFCPIQKEISIDISNHLCAFSVPSLRDFGQFDASRLDGCFWWLHLLFVSLVQRPRFHLFSFCPILQSTADQDLRSLSMFWTSSFEFQNWIDHFPNHQWMFAPILCDLVVSELDPQQTHLPQQKTPRKSANKTTSRQFPTFWQEYKNNPLNTDKNLSKNDADLNRSNDHTKSWKGTFQPFGMIPDR